MPNSTILDINIESESNDAPKKFKNIDKEDFEFNWNELKYSVKTGEIQVLPKYLVNFAAMHLAKKMVKRELMEKIPSNARETGLYKIRDPKREWELQKEMVKENFPEEPSLEPVLNPVPEPTIEPVIEEPILEQSKPTEIPQTKPKEEHKCDVCGFVAKNKIGLISHKRFKHK